MSEATPRRTLFNQPVSGLMHLLIVYVIWGSTYLAIRVAVRDGSGWDPFSMAGSRLLIAGVLLLVIAKLRGERVIPTRAEWLRLSIYAFFIWFVGNGIVVWAEQKVPSAQAALIVGTAPIWGALYEAFLDKRVPGWKMIAGLLLGFVGLVFLINPGAAFDGEGHTLQLIMIVIATFSWCGGVVYQARKRVGLSSIASSGWQQLLASFGFGVLFFTLEGSMPTPTTEAWIAWGFLVVFGSLIAFTSYVIIVKVLPTSIVLTHSYVNPAVAVFLGWLILSEVITWSILLGAVLIMAGLWGVFTAKQRRQQSHMG